MYVGLVGAEDAPVLAHLSEVQEAASTEYLAAKQELDTLANGKDSFEATGFDGK